MLQLNALPRILWRFVGMVGELEGGNNPTENQYGMARFERQKEVLRQYNVGKVEKDWKKKNQKQTKSVYSSK